MRAWLRWVCVAALCSVGPAFAPAALAQIPGEEFAFGMCSGSACCVKGGSKVNQTCVKREVLTVRRGDGQGWTKVRIVQRWEKGKDFDRYTWGMADTTGRILVPPRYHKIEPISDTVAWAQRPDGAAVMIVNGKEQPSPFAIAVRVRPTDGPHFVFGLAKEHADGTYDLAPFSPAGEPGPVLRRVLKGPQGIAAAAAGVLVVAMKDEAGALGSAYLDAGGQVIWAGPETKVFRGAWGFQSACQTKAGSADYRGLSVSLVLGPSPVFLGDNRLFRPLDARGAPMPLPAGVVGLTPLIRGMQTDYPCTPGWAVVSRNGEAFQYRLGWGSPAMVLADFDKLLPLDDLRLAEPTPYPDERRRATYQINDGLVVGKASGTSDWYVTDRWSPRIAQGDKAWGRSSVAAADSFIAEAYSKVLAAAAEREAVEAKIRAERAERRAFFDANIARGRSLDATTIGRLRWVALDEGGERATRYWSTLGDRRADAEAFCDHVPDACTAVAEKKARYEADMLEHARRRSSIDAAFAAAARGPDPNPNVKVTIYEGGRVRTEVMPRSLYENVYAPK